MADKAEERRRALQEYFQQSEQKRKEAREQRDASNEEKEPTESIDLFWKYFLDTTADLQAQMNTIEAALGENNTALQVELESMGPIFQEVQKRITDSTLFLPSYDVRRAQEELSAILERYEQLRSEVAPRKKFAFGKRDKQQKKKREETDTLQEVKSDNPIPTVEIISKALGFSDKRGEELTFCETDASEIEKSSADFILKNLTSCTIRIPCVLFALRLVDLTDCTILSGPISGSVYVENCRNCTICVASRQLRIHTTHECNFYVHTRSGPIIEDCSSVRFAPYSLEYNELAQHMDKAELSGKENFWNDVKDFKWHRVQQSPNWSLLPEHEQRTFRI